MTSSSATRTTSSSRTLRGVAMPRRKDPVQLHPSYVRALRARVEAGPGVLAVAKAAGISRITVWRVLAADEATSDTKQGATLDAIEKVRSALAELEPHLPEVPPPVIAVQGPEHHAWARLGERLIAADRDAVARALAEPDAVERAVLGRTLKRTTRRGR